MLSRAGGGLLERGRLLVLLWFGVWRSPEEVTERADTVVPEGSLGVNPRAL